MPKQRYLLILLLLCILPGLYAELRLETYGCSVLSDDKPVWMGIADLEYSMNPSKAWKLNASSRINASDMPLEQFPQKQYLLNKLQAQYTKNSLSAKGTYWNTVYGSSWDMDLYPQMDMGAFTYTRQHQHQGNLELGGSFGKLQGSAYLYGKMLYATPTSYVLDPITFETIAVEHEQESYEDVFTGMQLSYDVLPQLSLGTTVDLKQANFDGSDLYTSSKLGLSADSEIRLGMNGRIKGRLTLQNRSGESFSPEARNLYSSEIRYQQKVGSNWNGFISFISNGCSDSKLNEYYIISNQVRTQLKYTAGYDPAQESYLLVGAKYSPRHSSNAVFSELRLLIIERLYGSAGIKVQPDLPNIVQSRVSWYGSSAMEFYLDYRNTQNEHHIRDNHFIGLGTLINF